MAGAPRKGNLAATLPLGRLRSSPVKRSLAARIDDDRRKRRRSPKK
jgi:hypothetical protein